MRSWAGVHLLASDPRGLVALMRLLRDPSASFSEDAELQDVSNLHTADHHMSVVRLVVVPFYF